MIRRPDEHTLSQRHRERVEALRAGIELEIETRSGSRLGDILQVYREDVNRFRKVRAA